MASHTQKYLKFMRSCEYLPHVWTQLKKRRIAVTFSRTKKIKYEAENKNVTSAKCLMTAITISISESNEASQNADEGFLKAKKKANR